MRDQFGVPWSRVWNMDETAVRILRAGDRGWVERGPKVNFIEIVGDRENCGRCR